MHFTRLMYSTMLHSQAWDQAIRQAITQVQWYVSSICHYEKIWCCCSKNDSLTCAFLNIIAKLGTELCSKLQSKFNGMYRCILLSHHEDMAFCSSKSIFAHLDFSRCFNSQALNQVILQVIIQVQWCVLIIYY